MERSNKSRRRKRKSSKINANAKSDRRLIILLGIFYLVGIIGISIPMTKELMVSLSHFHLLLSFGVLVFSRLQFSPPYFIFLFSCYVMGVVVEWIGVHSGYLFGNYYYGSNLGAKLEGVPWIIGVNWILMIMSSQAIARKYLTSNWAILFGSALLMTLLDVVIEPVAMELDFWHWKDGVIPFYNYFCWFVVSLPMHFLYQKLDIHENSSVAKAIFWMMAVFFIVLNII